MAFELRSDAFEAGGDIPRRHTCDGENVSPPLAWSEPPAGTKSLALVCDDPDAPAGTWVHWVLYDLPVSSRALPEGGSPPGRQGTNDFKKTGYGGPCPPKGPAHRYFFRLYALDAPTGLPPGATKSALVKAIDGHTLGQAELMGRYARH